MDEEALPRTTRWSTRRLLAVLAVATIPLLPALRVGFLADDFVGAIFLRERGFHLVVSELLGKGGEFLRPLSFLFYWVEGTLLDLDPVLLHAVHLLLFAGVGWLAALLASRIAGRRAAPWALLFVLWYPAHAEAHLWIAAIFDLLAAFLVLAGLLAVVPDADGEGRRHAVASALAFGLLAPLAKEVGWAFPLVATSWWLLGLLPTRPRGTGPRIVIAAWAGAVLSVVYRLATLGGLGGYPDTLARLHHGVSAVPGLLLHAAFLPANPSFGAWSVAVNAACAVAALALAATAVVHLRRTGRGTRLIAAGLSVALATLLPALPYLQVAVYWRNSRYLTLPGIGLALAAAGLATAASGLRRVAGLTLASAWLAALVLATGPWLQAARARDLLLGAIGASTTAPGRHTVWVQGPIGDIRGAQFLGGHLWWAIRYRFPDRTIQIDSAWDQRHRGQKPAPPCARPTSHCHLFRFRPDPPSVKELRSMTAAPARQSPASPYPRLSKPARPATAPVDPLSKPTIAVDQHPIPQAAEWRTMVLRLPHAGDGTFSRGPAGREPVHGTLRWRIPSRS